MTVKEQVLSAISSLPEDASLEDAMDKLLFLSKIDSGLKDIEEGRVFSHEEAKTKLGL